MSREASIVGGAVLALAGAIHATTASSITNDLESPFPSAARLEWAALAFPAGLTFIFAGCLTVIAAWLVTPWLRLLASSTLVLSAVAAVAALRLALRDTWVGHNDWGYQRHSFDQGIGLGVLALASIAVSLVALWWPAPRRGLI